MTERRPELRSLAREPRRDEAIDAGWVPRRTEEHEYRARLDADVKPLADMLKRLRDRGLLD